MRQRKVEVVQEEKEGGEKNQNSLGKRKQVLSVDIKFISTVVEEACRTEKMWAVLIRESGTTNLNHYRHHPGCYYYAARLIPHLF